MHINWADNRGADMITVMFGSSFLVRGRGKIGGSFVNENDKSIIDVIG